MQQRHRVWVIRIVKLCVLAGVIAALAVASSKISAVLQTIRTGLDGVSVAIMIPVFIVINIVRKLCPPIYMLFPVGTVMLIYFADKFGPDLGACWYELFRLQDIYLFIILRRWYCPLADMVINPERKIKWFSEDVRKGLYWVEKNWMRHFAGRRWWYHALVVVAWSLALYMEEYVCLFWLATRTPIHLATFSCAYVVGSVLEYPKNLVKMRAFENIADAAGSGNFFSAFTNLKSLPWYDIVSVVVLTGVSTIFVHGFHLQILVMGFVDQAKQLRQRWRNRGKPQQGQQQQQQQVEASGAGGGGGGDEEKGDINNINRDDGGGGGGGETSGELAKAPTTMVELATISSTPPTYVTPVVLNDPSHHFDALNMVGSNETYLRGGANGAQQQSEAAAMSSYPTAMV